MLVNIAAISHNLESTGARHGNSRGMVLSLACAEALDRKESQAVWPSETKPLPTYRALPAHDLGTGRSAARSGQDKSKEHAGHDWQPYVPQAEVEQAGNGSCSAYLSGCCPGHHPAHAGQQCYLNFCRHPSLLCWLRACAGAPTFQLYVIGVRVISLLSSKRGMRASVNDMC